MEFGEVVTPSSRAFWNDYEDLDNRTADPTPVAVFDTVAETVSRDKLRSVQKLVVLEGRQGIFDFAAATIARGPAQEKCLLRIGNGCVVYLVDDAEDTALVLSEIPDVMQYGPVTEQLVQLLNEREVPWVITISVEPAVAYKSAAINETDVVNPCFLRSIASACGTTNAVKALTEPNLITGIAASCMFTQFFRFSRAYIDEMSAPHVFFFSGHLVQNPRKTVQQLRGLHK